MAERGRRRRRRRDNALDGWTKDGLVLFVIGGAFRIGMPFCKVTLIESDFGPKNNIQFLYKRRKNQRTGPLLRNYPIGTNHWLTFPITISLFIRHLVHVYGKPYWIFAYNSCTGRGCLLNRGIRKINNILKQSPISVWKIKSHGYFGVLKFPAR